MSNKGNIKTSILLVLLKCIIVGYSNGNESFTGRLFSNYRLLNKLFHFFRYLIYTVFHDTFAKRFIKKLVKSISRCSILKKNRMSNFVIQKWRPFEYKVKSWKICPFSGLEIKNADILNFSWIKYFGNDFSFLKKLPFDCKLVYILGKTVQDMVLDSYFRQIASGQVTSFWCFSVIFEINRCHFIS